MSTEFLPLLPAQRAVQARLDRAEELERLTDKGIAACSTPPRCADGTYIEPLHHKRHPQGTKRFPKEMAG